MVSGSGNYLTDYNCSDGKTGRFFNWQIKILLSLGNSWSKKIFLFIIGIASALNAFSQGCTSNDFVFQEFYIGDANGLELTSPCTAGTPVTGFLWLKVVGNATRYSLYVDYSLSATNNLTGITTTTSITNCLYSKIAIPKTLIKLGNITWNCGEVLKIHNFKMSWQQNISGECTFEEPKCSFVPLAVIRTPLSVDFTYKSCNNGTNTSVNFTSLTTGGSNTYSYLWTFSDGSTSTLANPVHVFANTAAPFSASLKVNDGIRESTLTKTIVAGSAITLSALPTQIKCFGGTGSVALSAAGGTAPYTFSGTPTSNLSAGIYNYQVTDANGCTATASATINASPPALSLSESHTAITCSPGSSTITLTGIGGSGTYEYKLDNGSYQPGSVFTGVASGNHILYIRDSNLCETSIPLTIPAYTVINSSVIADTCVGSSYDLSKSISNYHPELYTYIITDSQGNVIASPYLVSVAGNYVVTKYQSPSCTLETQTIQLVIHPKPGSPLIKIN
ncbi:PKD domain-containing protein [Daejeonella oryzae]|uniref:PKD domain-containing protein n=1 Tax=Daejeonella oryzae TaxID=1122943 RepID=UPI00041DCB1E|nr:PKD domain-containing protein [Daejeonella oryzae]